MNYQQLTTTKRKTIEILLRKNYPITQITNEIGFHKNTGNREIKQRSNLNSYLVWPA